MQSHQQLVDEADDLLARAIGAANWAIASIYLRQAVDTHLTASIQLSFEACPSLDGTAD